MPHVCHAVDRMGDPKVRFKCAKVVRPRTVCGTCDARRPIGPTTPIPMSARTVSVGKLRHLASVRLTCMHLDAQL